MMNLKKFGAFALVGLALCGAPAITSCNTNRPAGEQISDAGITSKVKAKFVTDSTVKGHNISVTTEEGVVYLTGRVATEEEKSEAERIARATSGVKDVVNHIKVGDRT